MGGGNCPPAPTPHPRGAAPASQYLKHGINPLFTKLKKSMNLGPVS